MSINNNAEKKSEPKKEKFLVDGWLRDPAFRGWFFKNKDNTKVRCTYCHKTIELSSSGRSALTYNAKGEKHIAISSLNQNQNAQLKNPLNLVEKQLFQMKKVKKRNAFPQC